MFTIVFGLNLDLVRGWSSSPSVESLDDHTVCGDPVQIGDEALVPERICDL